MATMARPYSHYSTAFASATYTDPAARVVHVADPDHANRNEPDPNPVWQAPPLAEVGAVGEYPGSEWLLTGGGVELDMTPDGHDGGDALPAYGTQRAAQAASGQAHGTDYGGSTRANWAAPMPRFVDERQDYVRIAGTGPGDYVGVDPVALQRGRNALAENNPEGYRAGEVHWERTERRFAIGERVHDQRVLHLNVAEGGGSNVPAKGGRYTSPFDSLARAITNVASRPQIRREPQGLSDDVLSDGALDSYNLAPSASVGEWVVG